MREPAETAFLDALGKLSKELGRLWAQYTRGVKGKGPALSDEEHARMWWCVERIISHTKAVIPMSVQHSGSIELPEVPVGLPPGILAALRAHVERAGGLSAVLGVPQLPAPQGDEGEE